MELTVAMKRSFVPAFIFVALICSCAYGDVGVVLNESLDSSVEWVTGSGHTSVYFSRICAESPVKLRLCRPGEVGSVMSNYINLGEDQRFEWNIVPFSVYVYGVPDARNRPIFGSEKIKAVLERRYRDRTLSAYCLGQGCRTSNKAEWRETVGAGMVRSMYIFAVRTTVQQDLDLIERFNTLPNENHFNGVTRNCADFAKNVVDTYFPHAAHRDVINDFGMTSPKAVARTFSRYALSHPESHFYVLHFSQLPGTIKRSTEARNGTEQLYHSKKLLVPMVMFATYEVPMIAAAHILTGHFNPEREFEEHPAIEVAQARPEFHASKYMTDRGRGGQFRPVETQDCDQVVGTPEEWKRYREEFASIVNEAVREEVIPSPRYVKHVLKHLDDSGKPFADREGALWMEVSEGSSTSKVGVSLDSIFAQGSDRQLAFRLLLARVDQVLRSPTHRRETMVEFKEDWALLEYAREQNSGALVTAAAHGSPPHARSVPAT
jgi:hypothetical protein